ncbi:two-component regulator propeller domain-containing protein [Niastella sp. OAS944]|uniref:ligand-binding sensor domain-containing protein n=1 Tax=Niastella sp. OAS944 TaxID=2664089 RepID=UPI0034946374|nr:ligand-binding sensor domain-containing protein [Chitinophagaceae bacterium OAS944]
MKNKRNVLYSLIIMLAGAIYFPVQAQQKNGAQNTVETKDVSSSHGPNSFVRTIKRDRKGNIWLVSNEGIFRFDGKSFTNITSKVSSARFWDVLEDRKGNLWFGTRDSGVYYYNARLNEGVGQGESLPAGPAGFQNFTTRDGLANDRVGNIYEDKTGNIWFGTDNGASRYDGKSFRSLKMKEAASVTSTDSFHISIYQRPIPEDSWMHNAVNSIIEDKTGKLWFGTRGYASVYDGKTFTTITNKDGKSFANVRSIIKDKKGNIWLGAFNGLWRYDGTTFTNFTQNFVGYIYEDKKGNIWTSSQRANNGGWVLSRYDEKSLANEKPTVTEIINKPMISAILEDDKGNIWFGASDGVYRYDGKTITDFKSKKL